VITSLRIRYSGAVPGAPGFGVSEFRTVLTGAWMDVGTWWHKEIRPKHFTTAGGTEYGYTPRSGERGSPGRKGFKATYTGRKLKKYGHTRPLELTGESKQATAASYDILPKSDGVRITMNAPRLQFRNRNSSINMADELTRVTSAERALLVRIHNRSMEARLRAVQTQTTKTFG
jgi:hypothetical protein